jgi:hypothetical protein
VEEKRAKNESMSPIVLFEGNCHATEKSEDIAMFKEMPVIPVNLVVDLKIIIGKRGLWRRKGVADKKLIHVTNCSL